MMNNDVINKLRGVIKEEITDAVKPIESKLGTVESKLGKVEKKLDILWDQVEKVTIGLEDVKETLNSHTATLKRIEDRHFDDTRKLNKRVTQLENQAGIVAPPEFTIAE